MSEAWYVVACDDSTTSGEGVLAGTIYELLRKNNVNTIPTELGVENFIRRLPLQLSRFIYLLKFLEALFLRLFGNKNVLYINYTPLWNPMIALLALSGVKLGPITGSIGVLSLQPSWFEVFLRRYVQETLVTLTLTLLPKNKIYWAATPSVFKRMKPKFNSVCFCGYPFLLSSKPVFLPGKLSEKQGEKKYDFLIYSKPHVLKNFDFSVSVAECLANMGFKVIFIGSALEERLNLGSYERVSSKMFDQMLVFTRAYLHLTSEDAGIACMKAMFLGKDIFYVKGSSAEGLVSDEFGFSVQFSGDVEAFVEKLVGHYSQLPPSLNKRSRARFKKLQSKTREVASKWALSST